METRVITVRMSARLHERLKEAAHRKCLSMNELAIIALGNAIEDPRDAAESGAPKTAASLAPSP